MLEVCASKIGDIILSVLESKMENKLDEVKKAKIISDTRKSICEFEEKYLQNHDGTVLTSREFGEYLQYSTSYTFLYNISSNRTEKHSKKNYNIAE